MESFYKTHKYLVEKVQSPVRRQLMYEIDWNHRLIGIKGSRGVGKTTFLLQYAKENFGSDRCCLYVNFNNFYFTQQNVKEIPTIYLHTKFLHEMKILLQKFNMKNPSLHFLLFLAILLYVPQEDILFYEKDSSLWITNLEEKKFCNYLLRKKVFHYEQK
jgi:DNA polymerase III delta prime subunit